MTSTINSSIVKVKRVGHNLITGDYISWEDWPISKPFGGIYAVKLDSLLTYLDYPVTRIDNDNFEFDMGMKATLAHTVVFDGQAVKDTVGNWVPLKLYDKAVTQNFALVVNNTVIKSRLNIYKIL